MSANFHISAVVGIISIKPHARRRITFDFSNNSATFLASVFTLKSTYDFSLTVIRLNTENPQRFAPLRVFAFQTAYLNQLLTLSKPPLAKSPILDKKDWPD